MTELNILTTEELNGKLTNVERVAAKAMVPKGAGLNRALKSEYRKALATFREYSTVGTAIVFNEMKFLQKDNVVSWETKNLDDTEGTSKATVVRFNFLDEDKCGLTKENQVVALMKYINREILEAKTDAFYTSIKEQEIPGLITDDEIEEKIESIAKGTEIGESSVLYTSKLFVLSSSFLRQYVTAA